jgi:hypothetical protein
VLDGRVDLSYLDWMNALISGLKLGLGRCGKRALHDLAVRVVQHVGVLSAAWIFVPADLIKRAERAIR